MKYIIKPNAAKDFYVEWSTVVDNWTFAGDRDTMLNHVGVTEDRLDRADKNGTSAIEPRGYLGWDDAEIIVREGPDGEEGMLARDRLPDWVHATSEEALEDEPGGATGILTPFDNEDEFIVVGPVGNTGNSSGPQLSGTGELGQGIVGEPGPELLNFRGGRSREVGPVILDELASDEDDN